MKIRNEVMRIFMKSVMMVPVITFAACLAGEGELTVYDPPVGTGQYLLTPSVPETPKINGAPIFGVRPGSPFLFAIPATGKRPMKFSVTGLPDGLHVNSENGQITGTIASMERKTYEVVFFAENALGKAGKNFKIVVSDAICLTPPMGWNSWNCWGGKVSQEKVISSAKAMVDKGLSQHGWNYMNIDDGWQGVRGGNLNAIQPNKKFPNMQKLAEEIHGMGLKLGIYSSPWRGTYEGHIGSYSDNEDGTYDWIKEKNHNEFFRYENKKENFKLGKFSFVKNDADQWAIWGVDYLKYDWIVVDVPHVKEMSEALIKSGRDVVYSLSNSCPFHNADAFSELSNAWRTTGDINDSWESVSGIGFGQGPWHKFAGPGHWNDPDMLVVGSVGWGSPKPSKLTPDEQYTHISLWCLLAAPLLIGCDLEKLDDFTLNLLSNDEVLAVDQDILGKQARQLAVKGMQQVWGKSLEDGSLAIGLFNLGDTPKFVSVSRKELEIQGSYLARDLWRQKDIGVFEDTFQAFVRPHGVVLVKLTKAIVGASSDVKSFGVKVLPKAPIISPKGGSVKERQKEISIDTGSLEGVIHFTTDGSEPTPASPVYSKPFAVDSCKTVKAVTVINGISSFVVSHEYYYDVGSIPEPVIKLTDLKADKATCGYGGVTMNRTINGNSFTMNGKIYEYGIGTHAYSEMVYPLNPAYKRFVATVGIDDEIGRKEATVQFLILIDGRDAGLSPVLKPKQSWNFDVEIPQGSKKITMISNGGEDGNSNDHANWVKCGFFN